MALSELQKLELIRLRAVVDAACMNESGRKDVEIETTGHNPSAKVTIRAESLRLFLERADA